MTGNFDSLLKVGPWHRPLVLSRDGQTIMLAGSALVWGSPKVARVREAIEAVGARVLYLPPYSPDFNPIEQVFAKVKALRRTAAARTDADLTIASKDAFAAVRPDECRTPSPPLDPMPIDTT